MASKDNKFASTEGGAMLSNNQPAQSSFSMSNLGRNSSMMPSNNNPGQEQDTEGNAQNNSELGNDELQNKESTGDKAQKEVMKKAGEAALTAAGVPNAAAKKIVDKAEETGALDKINEQVNKIKKKKMSIIISIISSIMPFFVFIIVIFAVLSVVGDIVGPVVEFVNNIIDFFTGSTEIEDKNEIYILDSLPGRSAENELKNYLSDEKKLENIAASWSATLAPIYARIDLYAETYSNSNNAEDDTLVRRTIFNSYNNNKKAVCYYTLSGFMVGTSNDSYADRTVLFDDDEMDAICSQYSNDASAVSKLLLNTLKEKTEPYSFSSEYYKDVLRIYELGYYDEASKTFSDAKFNISFMQDSHEISFKDQLLKVYGSDISNSSNENERLYEASEKYYSRVLEYYSQFYSDFYSYIKNVYMTGSAAELDLISTLGSIYGNDSCATLVNYHPLTHEYTESQGVSNDEIHSVSDGEVVYVKNDVSNLYRFWDSTKQKCMCNGFKCDNYDGNQIKVKFVVDDIEYIATYSNLNEIKVQEGDLVKKGDIIATEGNSGCTNSKKLKFQLTSESGINYNTNELLERCSSSSATMNACNFNNIKIQLVDCNNALIKEIPFYEYVLEELYRDFKVGINNQELLKAGAISIATNILRNNNYEVGVSTLTIQDCNYQEIKISETDSLKLNKAINEVRGQVLTYNDKFALARYELNCSRDDLAQNANSVYNAICINKALTLINNGKNYEDILEIYYPNYELNQNYCLNYASSVNKYILNNNKNYLSISEEDITKTNAEIKEKINIVGLGTRAGAVEAARYLTLGLEGKIPYKNGGKYFDYGITSDLTFDSCGFISWVLYNGGVDIDKSLTISQLIKSPNITGNLKINAELYKNYDQIQVGDFAYREDRIGIIIGKNDGTLYVAEANLEKGLIVTTISAYGISESNYTHIYFADNYYNGNGNVTSMW